MPGLKAVDLYVGRALRLGKILHHIARFENAGATLVLTVKNGSDAEIGVSRTDLHASICDETATLEDPTEDPATAALMPEVNLGLHPVDQIINWYDKMILLRALMPYANHSPQSLEFRRAYDNAVRLLQWVRAESNIGRDKLSSAKTVNDVLRQLRSSRHAGQLGSVDLPGGGCPSSRGSVRSMAAHVGAIDVQIVDWGDILFGSSRVPTLTAVKCGLLCEVISTCVPHMGQNRQYMTFPLSAMNLNSLGSPSTVNAAVLKSALTVPLPPPIVWHIRHQHARVVTGSSAIR